MYPMYQNHRIGAVLLMGGSGIRCGGDVPKQFQLLGKKPVYRYALETLLATDLFDEIVLVCHPRWIDKIEMLSPMIRVIAGETTRQASSFAGLKAFSQSPAIVLIHDAVRPFVTKKMILENIQAALSVGAANTCIPSADTLVFAPKNNVISSIPKREDFLRGQTPQTFRFDWIMKAHEQAQKGELVGMSDDCCLVLALGYPVVVVRGSENNLKITTALDLSIAMRFQETGSTAHELFSPVSECRESKADHRESDIF